MRRPIVSPTHSRIATLLTILLVLAACGPASESPANGGEPSAAPQPSQPTGASDAAAPSPGTSLSACELVTAGDIEAALGLDEGTVAEGTLEEQPTVLDPAANQCTYDQDAWGGLVVNVTPTDGVNAWDAMSATTNTPAESLDVGDAGLWFEDSDRGYFLKGSVLILLQFTHLVEPDASFRDPTVYLGTAAVAKISPVDY